MSLMKLKGTATIDDLLRTPKDGRIYELVDGEIIVSPAGMRHGEVVTKISLAIATYLDKNSIGKAYSPDTGIALPDGNIRCPDVTVVLNEKLPGGESPDTFGELVPDFVVEVLSPGDSMKEVGRKIGEFLECGVPLVWLADPKHKTVTTYRSLSETKQYTLDDTITAEPILPGFSCPISKFF
jgi:Uma2 family endonuclease